MASKKARTKKTVTLKSGRRICYGYLTLILAFALGHKTSSMFRTKVPIRFGDV